MEAGEAELRSVCHTANQQLVWGFPSDYVSQKLGRPVEWGGKKQWTKGKSSIGTSTKMSVVADDGGGMVQKFASDGGIVAPTVSGKTRRPRQLSS